ncbi:predicted protein [Chaetoceros tenuissimus]|uniref:C2H2-type domain-containing protein n=1 Tax=Chaetoceros tenuissimus TaxID=426638 RepID=A0AAD3CYC4_9STRA|nr:predicted protein [Chaetoceros tenuissimus]
MHELDKRYSLFLQNERNRLNEIENLQKDGKLNDVFRTLIQDCDVEDQNPIHYILQQMKDSSSFESRQNHLLGLVSKEHQCKEAISCSSPNKATRQKYCISNRHKGKSVKIRIHNQLALCRECFVLHTGQPAVEKNGIIYRKEDRQLIRELLSNRENQSKDMDLLRGDLQLKNENTQEANETLQHTKTHKAGVLHGSKIAKKLLLIKQSIDNRKNRAAITIQIFYRYFKHRQKQSQVECIEDASNKPVLFAYKEPDNSYSRQKLEKLFERLESTSKTARMLKLNSNVVKLKKPKNMTTKLGGEKTTLKQVCEAKACSICKVSKRTTPGGRQNIVCIPCYQEIAPSIREEMKTLFECVDHLRVGSIPKTTFTRIIRDIWIKQGYELLVDEELSIVNHFQSGQDGHIDYIKFLEVFATQSRFGCRHGRIMCSLCNQNKNIETNQRAEVRKRGFQVYQNLENTLSHRKRPDQSCNVHLSDVEDSFREWRSPRKSSHHQIIALGMNPISTGQQKRKQCANMVQKRELHFSDDAPNHVHSRIQDPIVAPKILKHSQPFSAQRLSLLLDENVKYTREQKDTNKRHTHKCPLCRFKFFDLNLLRNHISRRHSLEDLQYVLNQAIDIEKSQTTPCLVQWGERFALVPPMEPPVHLFICHKHVPPHPNCHRCQESFQQCCMYPPIRFYRSAFVQIQKSLNGNSGKEKENAQEMYLRFHFSLKNPENAIVFHGESGTERRLGKIVAICSDGREQNFIGIQEYLPIRGTDNEVCLDFNVIFIPFEQIIDRQLVLSLEEDQDVEEVSVKLGNQNKDEVKICKYELKSEQKINV